MIPPQQIPVPDALPTAATWPAFRTRLTNWAARVVGAFSGIVLRPVVVVLAPNGTTGSVDYQIEADSDGAAKALLIADGSPLLFTAGAPAAGQWSMVVGTGSTAITLGTPATVCWLAYLVAR